MRSRLNGLLVALAVVTLATPVLAAQAVHLAPEMPMSLDVAPLPRAFFMHAVDLDYAGGRVILASNPDGTGNLHTNDEFQMAVVHADGTASWYRHDYAGDPSKAPGETPPVDLTALFRPGVNRIETRLRDLYGARFAVHDYYAVNFAEGEAAPEVSPVQPWHPEPEAFIYAETPVFVETSPGPIDLCVLSPAGGEEAVARIQIGGRRGAQPEPLRLTLSAGFNRVAVPLGDLPAGAYLLTGSVQVGDRVLEIRPHPISRIAPPFTEGEMAAIISDLQARLEADQARVAAGQEACAAAADALVTRAAMERVGRCGPASLAAEVAPDPDDIEARARLLLSCSRLVESDAVGRAAIDRVRALQGEYLDWGRQRYAKMAAAPGRVRYERGALRTAGDYHNLTLYWANLPLAGVLRFVPKHSRRVDPIEAWREFGERGATEITLAGRPALLFGGWNGGVRLVTRTSRFDLEVVAGSEEMAIGLAERALAEKPFTAALADAVLADLKPPVAVRGIEPLLAAAASPDLPLAALKQSVARVGEGRFKEAMQALEAAPSGSLTALACDGGRTLYGLTTAVRPNPSPLPAGGAGIACWSESPRRQYLLLQYDSSASRREAAATLLAVLDLLPGRQMLVGDLHQHSNVSDGMGDPEEMFFQTVSHFTDFHALTDHNTLRGAEAIAQALPSWGLNYPFLVGEEVTCDFAHIVAIDPGGLVDWKGEPEEVARRVRDSGAVAILAHPWRTDFQERYRRNPAAQPRLDAFQHNPRWYADWERRGIIPPMVEVTDTHDMSLAEPFRAIVFAQAPTPPSIKQALLEGNCCAWSPDGPKGPDRVRRVVWALISDRDYYEARQLDRMAQRALQLR